jgi:hypothetical protein
MSRNVRFGMLAAAALLVAAAMGVNPPSASAIQCCYCDSEVFYTQCWGKGADCAAAQANFPSACATAAREFCWSIGYDNYCTLSSQITSSCWYDAGIGMYVFDGLATHKCKWCEDCGGGGGPFPP